MTQPRSAANGSISLRTSTTSRSGPGRIHRHRGRPVGSLEHQSSLTPAHRAIGPTVSAVWQKLLCHPDRFLTVDNATFPDHDVTSWDYDAHLAWDLDELLRICECDVEDFLHASVEFDGDVLVSDEGVEMTLGTHCTFLEFQCSVAEFWDHRHRRRHAY